jgi:hypothetical protein
VDPVFVFEEIQEVSIRCQPFLFHIGQEAGEQSQQGQESAEAEDMADAGMIGQSAQDGCPYPAHSKGQTEE